MTDQTVIDLNPSRPRTGWYRISDCPVCITPEEAGSNWCALCRVVLGMMPAALDVDAAHDLAAEIKWHICATEGRDALPAR